MSPRDTIAAIATATGAAGVGVIFCVSHITTRLITGRMKYGSGAVRFWIQPIHGAWRISTLSSSIQ